MCGSVETLSAMVSISKNTAPGSRSFWNSVLPLRVLSRYLHSLSRQEPTPPLELLPCSYQDASTRRTVSSLASSSCCTSAVDSSGPCGAEEEKARAAARGERAMRIRERRVSCCSIIRG